MSGGGSALCRAVRDAVIAHLDQTQMARKAAELDALHERFKFYGSRGYTNHNHCSNCNMIRNSNAIIAQCQVCHQQIESCGSVYCKVENDPGPYACPRCVGTPRCARHKRTEDACSICGIELCIGCYVIHPRNSGNGTGNSKLVICSDECVAEVAHGKRARVE